MKRPPWWEKQKEALQFAKKRADEGKGVALFAACGTGKTRVAINWLQHLFVHKDVKLVYIVAPIAVLPVWIDNWYDWATAPVAFIDLHETGSAGLRKAQELASVSDFPVICLVNYEAAWQIGHKRIEHMRNGEPVKTLDKVDTTMNDLNWDAGILDEVTAIKTPGSKVSKFFRRKMAPRTTYKMVLTGSAYTKRPLDVWAPVNYACGDEVFSKAFLPFKTEYAIPHPYIRGAVIGYRNLEDLVLRLSKVAVMLKKEDMFDLPPFVHETRIIELSPRSRKVYNDIRDEQVAEIEASEEEWKAFKAGKTDERPKTVTAEHIFTSIRKLSQITGGFVYPDPDEDTPDIKPTPV
jgi:SNF2 family DNA or RNA helicase